MNKISLTAAAALAMVSAACSKEKPAEEPTPTETPTPAEAAGEASAMPAETIHESGIPQLLQGRWGLVLADCTSTRGDAKGLLTVSADKLEFYESVAKLGPVREVDDDSVSASFEFTGEGENWIQEVALSTSDGGKTLVREDTGPQAQPGPLKYTRCG